MSGLKPELETESDGERTLSIDEMCQEFMAYRKRKQKQLAHERAQHFSVIDREREKLRSEIAQMRKSIDGLRLELREVVAQNRADIENASNEDVNTLKTCSACQQHSSALYERETGQTLLVTSKSTCCLFEHCDRRLDSQLLLVHYLSDHRGVHGLSEVHELAEGQRVVLGFDLVGRPLGENQVIGLLAYSGTIEQTVYRPKRRIVYNSFLTDQHQHLQSHLPITVMLCKTVPSALLINKVLAKRTSCLDPMGDLLYVFWLVSPIEDKHINATLLLYGRDPAAAKVTVIAVRPISHAQNANQFMPLDSNYFCLTYGEMQQLTNDFRDELHLEVSLTELKPQQDLLQLRPCAH